MLDRVMTLSKEDTLKVLAGVSLMSKEEIAARNRLLEKLEENVIVKDNENSRRMIIKDLDSNIFRDNDNSLEKVIKSVLDERIETGIYDSTKMDIGEKGSLAKEIEYIELIENDEKKEYSVISTYSYSNSGIDNSLYYQEDYAA